MKEFVDPKDILDKTLEKSDFQIEKRQNFYDSCSTNPHEDGCWRALKGIFQSLFFAMIAFGLMSEFFFALILIMSCRAMKKEGIVNKSR